MKIVNKIIFVFLVIAISGCSAQTSNDPFQLPKGNYSQWFYKFTVVSNPVEDAEIVLYTLLEDDLWDILSQDPQDEIGPYHPYAGNQFISVTPNGDIHSRKIIRQINGVRFGLRLSKHSHANATQCNFYQGTLNRQAGDAGGDFFDFIMIEATRHGEKHFYAVSRMKNCMHMPDGNGYMLEHSYKKGICRTLSIKDVQNHGSDPEITLSEEILCESIIK